NLLLLRIPHAPGRPQQRLAEDVVERSDPLLADEHVVARAARVEPGPRLDAKELLRLRLVGVEADVLLDLQLLLPHEGDRPARRRLARSERCDPVEVRNRPHELVDEELVVVETVLTGHPGIVTTTVRVRRAWPSPVKPSPS